MCMGLFNPIATITQIHRNQQVCARLPGSERHDGEGDRRRRPTIAVLSILLVLPAALSLTCQAQTRCLQRLALLPPAPPTGGRLAA